MRWVTHTYGMSLCAGGIGSEVDLENLCLTFPYLAVLGATLVFSVHSNWTSQRVSGL